ncbi:unnamed protein product [Zymoseptoria tritici ST99CH_3D1]|nr:unnamed protein product [Zymoseptoria tritici ST99CH_3D1]
MNLDDFNLDDCNFDEYLFDDTNFDNIYSDNMNSDDMVHNDVGLTPLALQSDDTSVQPLLQSDEASSLEGIAGSESPYSPSSSQTSTSGYAFADDLLEELFPEQHEA